MKKGRNINVKMYRVVGDLNPFVEVGYLDRDAQEHVGLMILDSGSNVNLLSSTVVGDIGDLCRHDDKLLEITDGAGEVIKTDYVHFSFAFGGKQFNEEFGIREDYHIGYVEELPIIGLLGCIFLQKHKLVIDYSDFTIHTSDVSHAILCSENCDFIFPMMIGLKNYGVPVLAIHHEGMDVAAIADTGSTINVISTQCISQCQLKCEYTEENDTLNGLKGSVEGKIANVHFCLLTCKDEATDSIPFNDSFLVINHPVAEWRVFSEKQIQPIEGLIGSPFMAKQGWTLDFSEKVIFKNKMSKNCN